MRIDLENGKYTYLYDKGSAKVLRYGEDWKSCTGDKFVLAMAQEIEELRELVDYQNSLINSLEDTLD